VAKSLHYLHVMKKILMVLTSHDKLGDTGKKTGFWLEEFAAPYYAFKDAGAQVLLASPLGGQPPLDPKSDAPDAQTPATVRFNGDTEAIAALAQTRKLSEVVDAEVDAVFYPGGHGPLWDLVDDADSLALIEKTFAAGKPVAAVCHGPAVLRNAKGALSQPLVKDKRVTGFSNQEEEAAQLTAVVPFLLEDALKAQGAHYEAGAAFQPHVVVDGRLVTGQNPASSEPAAQAVLKLLG
jgi:putative intracellular protease/amidase